jgi:hypothetical protein
MAVAVATVPSTMAAQGTPPSLTQFLQQSIGLHPDEIRAVTSGSCRAVAWWTCAANRSESCVKRRGLR